MFHKIKDVIPSHDYCLSVRFSEGCTKIYDVKPLFDKIPVFTELKDGNRFEDVHIDVGGHGIAWNDRIDLSCKKLWDNGILEVKKLIKTTVQQARFRQPHIIFI